MNKLLSMMFVLLGLVETHRFVEANTTSNTRKRNTRVNRRLKKSSKAQSQYNNEDSLENDQETPAPTSLAAPLDPRPVSPAPSPGPTSRQNTITIEDSLDASDPTPSASPSSLKYDGDSVGGSHGGSVGNPTHEPVPSPQTIIQRPSKGTGPADVLQPSDSPSLNLDGNAVGGSQGGSVIGNPTHAPAPLPQTNLGRPSKGTEPADVLQPSDSPAAESQPAIIPAPAAAPVTLTYSPAFSPWPSVPPNGMDVLFSIVPSDSPSIILVSDAPSVAPSPLPQSFPSHTTPTTYGINFTSSPYILDPTDPNSFVCPNQNPDAETQLQAWNNDTTSTSLIVTFLYQLWLDDDDTANNITVVLRDVGMALTAAVADSLLTCQEDKRDYSVRLRRRLDPAGVVWRISSYPNDTEKGQCDSGCHRINGALTLQTIGTTGAENLQVVCGALDVIQDPATMTRIATSIDGVGAIRYEKSNVDCPEEEMVVNGSDGGSAETDASATLQSTDSENTLEGGATIGIIMGAVLVFVTILGVARKRRRSQAGEQVADADTNDDDNNNNDMLSFQICHTMSSLGGGGYTILADTNSLRDPQEEQDEELDFSMLSKSNFEPRNSTAAVADEHKTVVKMWDSSPFFDQTDLPDRLSLESAEGGSEESDNSDNSETLAQYATPVQLSSAKKNPKSSNHNTSNTEEMQQSTTDMLASPVYPGLSSLLGRATSDSDGSSTTDDDRSIVQLVFGGARLLKLSDLEQGSAADKNDDSTTSQDDGEEL